MQAEALSQDLSAKAKEPGKIGVQFSVEEITPADAEKILAGPLRVGAGADVKANAKAIASYAAMMRAGGWIMNGQPLVFDTENTLVDGVLRVHAIKDSGVTIRTLVARNVRADTLHTIDQHRRRSYTGVLESRGVAHAGTVMKTMSKLIRIENGSLGRENLSISYQRYDRVLEANPELHEAVAISKASNDSVLVPTARPALIFMALKAGKGEGETGIREFLRGTVNNSPFEFTSPARMLNLQLSIAREAKNPIDVDNSLALSILAFNDFNAGKSVTTHYSWKPDFGGAKLDTRGLPKDRKEMLALAPPNLGLPLVNGYPGLAEGHIDVATEASQVGGQTVADIVRGSQSDEGREEVRMLMVTPDMARRWLKRFNRGNRKIQQNHIAMIKRDIEKDNWMMNAQPICFWGDPETATQDDEARLLNGQHRLMACIQADKPIEVPIAINIPEEAFATYDTHAKRALRGTGPRVDDRVINAAARLQWKTDNGIPFSTRMSPSATEIKETVEKHPGLMECFGRARKFGKTATAGVMTWFIYHVLNEHNKIGDQFLTELETGLNLVSGNPVQSLRDTLRSNQEGWSRVSDLALLTSGWESYKAWVEAGMPSGPASGRKRSKAEEPVVDENDIEDEEDMQPTLI